MDSKPSVRAAFPASHWLVARVRRDLNEQRWKPSLLAHQAPPYRAGVVLIPAGVLDLGE